MGGMCSFPAIYLWPNYVGASLAGDQGSIPGWGRSPGEENGNPLQLPGESHGRKSLVRYSLWGQKESDMTERLHFHFLSFQTMLEVMKIMVTSLKPGTNPAWILKYDQIWLTSNYYWDFPGSSVVKILCS